MLPAMSIGRMPPPQSPQPVTCEVCGTAQLPASACQVCGLPLKVPRGYRLVGDPPIEPLPGLEATQLGAVGDVPAGTLPGLEFTRLEDVPELVDAAPAGFEPTFVDTPDVPPVFGDLPGLERTAESFDRASPALRRLVACPFCHHGPVTGRVCDGCGRSLVRFLNVEVAEAERVIVRCRTCGAGVEHRDRCSECGNPLPTLETV